MARQRAQRRSDRLRQLPPSIGGGELHSPIKGLSNDLDGAASAASAGEIDTLFGDQACEADSFAGRAVRQIGDTAGQWLRARGTAGSERWSPARGLTRPSRSDQLRPGRATTAPAFPVTLLGDIKEGRQGANTEGDFFSSLLFLFDFLFNLASILWC